MLLRPQKPPKMTKMAGVAQANPPFAKNTVFATVKGGLGTLSFYFLFCSALFICQARGCRRSRPVALRIRMHLSSLPSTGESRSSCSRTESQTQIWKDTRDAVDVFVGTSLQALESLESDKRQGAFKGMHLR